MATLLLAVHCKKTDSLDLKTPIWNYIASTYSDQQANDASDDLAVVQQLRGEVVGLTGSLQQLRDTLSKYFRALALMETRFPISKEREHVMVSFTWYDSIRPTKRTEQYSIHFEKAAVLFNVGAVLSQQAIACDRSSDQGIKDAARRFQEAAGVFAYLRDVVSLKVEAPRPVDISPECAGMLEKLCLAQAQECTFEKARMDKKNPALLARLCKQVAVFYDDVLRALNQFPLNQHFDKSWTLHVSVKAVLYAAEAEIQAAAGLHAQEEIAPEIARLKEAQRVLLPIKKDVKQCSKELNDGFKRSEDLLIANLAKAERENSTVYLQRIPNFADLPAVLGASLVKSIPPPDLDASTEDLFGSVIPDTSAKALSKYSELVDEVYRTQMDKLAAASDEARIKLREWELPECLQALEAGSANALPDALRAELEDLEEHGGVRHLQDLGAQIKDLRNVAVEELGKVEGDLEREAREDGELREKYGARWNRPASTALNSTMREKVAGYRANLAAAGESDGRLEQRLVQNTPGFAALSLDAAVQQMPRLQAPMVSMGDVEPSVVVTTLRQGLEALNQLSTERAGLEEALKVEKNKDNILPKIMASTSNYDALFKEELKKYAPLQASIEENVQRQAQLLDVIGKNQAAYRHAFGYPEWRAACEAGAAGMRGKLALYKEVRENMSEGLRFYMSLQEAIATLQQQTGDYCLTRRLQRDDMLEDIRKAADASSRQEREAAERAARERAAQHLAQMTLTSSQSGYGQAAGQPAAPQAYPPPYQAAQQAAQTYSQPPLQQANSMPQQQQQPQPPAYHPPPHHAFPLPPQPAYPPPGPSYQYQYPPQNQFPPQQQYQQYPPPQQAWQQPPPSAASYGNAQAPASQQAHQAPAYYSNPYAQASQSGQSGALQPPSSASQAPQHNPLWGSAPR
ncbi:hypothetical protein WJX72_011897 [[Myrmecia] bisecta]|uniref:BRO1 domain-containing protein n=1 Tax=[Myrmecia] bisecta TaxID=41462 RepID=A0AAW1QH39_9CHLO